MVNVAMGLPAYLFPRHRRGVTATLMKYVSGVEDAYGNASAAWTEWALLKGCAFDPGSSSEPRLAGQERVIVEPTLYAAYDAPIEAHDRLIVGDQTFEVEGVARRWENPFSGRRMGCVVALRLVTG